jgi:hypothetical protein
MRQEPHLFAWYTPEPHFSCLHGNNLWLFAQISRSGPLYRSSATSPKPEHRDDDFFFLNPFLCT